MGPISVLDQPLDGGMPVGLGLEVKLSVEADDTDAFEVEPPPVEVAQLLSQGSPVGEESVAVDVGRFGGVVAVVTSRRNAPPASITWGCAQSPTSSMNMAVTEGHGSVAR
jgi:hypothetical protein